MKYLHKTTSALVCAKGPGDRETVNQSHTPIAQQEGDVSKRCQVKNLRFAKKPKLTARV